jgi:hypothetical protein
LQAKEGMQMKDNIISNSEKKLNAQGQAAIDALTDAPITKVRFPYKQ